MNITQALATEPNRNAKQSSGNGIKGDGIKTEKRWSNVFMDSR